MRSIDNLRDYVLTAPSICSTTRAILVGYIDEIEREVEEAREREYQSGREDAEGAAEFADRLCRAAERREDVTLWGVDYTPLPVDADGVPIHVGDVMEFTYDPPQDQPTFEVSGFGAAGTLFYAARGKIVPRKTTNSSVVRHRRSQTVEDVLTEFACSGIHIAAEEGIMAGDFNFFIDEEALAEYAAKLRLAGDE